VFQKTKAFEIKRRNRVFPNMLSGLKAFLSDYADAEGFLIYRGNKQLFIDGIKVVPIIETFKTLKKII
jgi:hypothetical protein